MDEQEIKNVDNIHNIANSDEIKDISEYKLHYSEKGFWVKIAKHYKKAGIKVVEVALSLYYSLRDDDTPSWARSIILGALGYFILPLDIIPDFVPIMGFSDDIVAMSVAIATVAIYVKEEHRTKAKQKVVKFFNQ
jgi:uncharacterized membrane protein YkvA (DUF1232 family)